MISTKLEFDENNPLSVQIYMFSYKHINNSQFSSRSF